MSRSGPDPTSSDQTGLGPTGLPEGALAGVRVIDLTRILSGPFCTMTLADLGAEVIKVEPPGRGDPVRGQGTLVDGLSWYFAGVNRNKRSLTLDLRQDTGRAVLAELLAGADVLVENFRPGTLDKMGLSAERLEAINPRLVVCSINGFGSTGPYADRPAFDFIAQAMSGFMSVNGAPDQPPMRAAPPMSDLVAGLYGALGVVSALQARERTGRGQRVETALTNGLISMLAYLSAEYFAAGEVPERTGNDHPLVAPYGLFQAQDGTVAVAPSNDTFVRRFLDALGLGDLLEDPRYDDNGKRMARRGELKEMIDERMQGQPREHWIERLNAAGVPCGRVKNLAEVFQDPQVLSQEMVLEIDQRDGRRVKTTGFPIKLAETPCAVQHPVPELGADTSDVLREHGYDPDAIARLRAEGTI